MFICDKESLKKFNSENRIWQGIPGVERTKGGRLFATFYSGATSETNGNYCVVVKSEDDGKTWTEPICAAYDGEMHRCFDSVLWIDPLGRLWFTWTRGHEFGVYGVICDDPDADELVWGEEFFIGRDIMMNKPTVLSSGEWLFPIAVWDWGYYSDTLGQIRNYTHLYAGDYFKERHLISGGNVYKTTDCGKTFKMTGGCRIIRNRSHDEHMIYEKKNGVLVMLTRLKTGISRSFSYDRGENWTIAEDTGIKGPNSRFHIRRLKSGRLLIINHDDVVYQGEWSERKNLTAFLSEDDGETWKYKLLLDERINVAYPDMTEGEDGYLYIIYDRDRGGYKTSVAEAENCAREIILTKINESDIINGKITSPKSFERRIVSKLEKYTGDCDFYPKFPYTDKEVFINEVLGYETDRMLETMFVYYPLNFLNMGSETAEKTDSIIEKIKGCTDKKRIKNYLAEAVNLLESVEKSEDNGRTEKLFEDMLIYFKDGGDIGEFSNKRGISRYYLEHLFNMKANMSVCNYKKVCAFTKAKELLITTHLTEAEICEKCGIFNHAEFVREFKKKEGISCAEYRKMNRRYFS